MINKRCLSYFAAHFCKASLLRNYVCSYIGRATPYQINEPITGGGGGTDKRDFTVVTLTLSLRE